MLLLGGYPVATADADAPAVMFAGVVQPKDTRCHPPFLGTRRWFVGWVASSRGYCPIRWAGISKRST